MDISMIIVLGLPVLYATGSLKKIVANTGVGGRCFVLYFVCTAALSFLPAVTITQNVSLNLAGTFFCIAPAVYLTLIKAYTCRFYIAFVLTTFVSVVSSLIFTYTPAYLPYLVIGIVSIGALIFFKARAPVFAPVLTGVFSVAGSMMQLCTDMYMTPWLDSLGTASVSLVICLVAAYLVTRRRGRHAANRRADIVPAQTENNKV
ncbi:MAG: hypothetical protein PHO15_08380 [Eubacteriales bacterium]|nr:hypothetical protein [Eubacteriales bacterium]